MSREVLYIADPMCSWCWGFAPVIAAIGERCTGRAPVSLVVGGLRPGTTEAMDEGAKTYIRNHWQHVSQRTGQPFDFAFFERKDFVYDTEPACRAAVTVRTLRPERTLEYFEALHRVFYVENQDITETGTLAGLAERFDLGGQDFVDAFGSEEMRERTSADFRMSRLLGIDGFPAVVVGDDESRAFLTLGYRPFEELEPALDSWLGDEAGA